MSKQEMGPARRIGGSGLASGVASVIDLVTSAPGEPALNHPGWIREADAAITSAIVRATAASSGAPPPVPGAFLTLAVAGASLNARLYLPEDLRSAVTVLFLHGGGWVCGSLQSSDPLCREIADVTGAALVSVEYRLAPEHPFPAPLHDAMTAVTWVASPRPRMGRRRPCRCRR